jgi:hypothetical protein
MDYRKQFLVEPGQKLHLKQLDPAFKGHHETHETAAPEFCRLSTLARMGPSTMFLLR